MIREVEMKGFQCGRCGARTETNDLAATCWKCGERGDGSFSEAVRAYRDLNLALVESVFQMVLKGETRISKGWLATAESFLQENADGLKFPLEPLPERSVLDELLKFVQHKPNCDWLEVQWHKGPCSCGLSELLKLVPMSLKLCLNDALQAEVNSNG